MKEASTDVPGVNMKEGRSEEGKWRRKLTVHNVAHGGKGRS